MSSMRTIAVPLMPARAMTQRVHAERDAALVGIDRHGEPRFDPSPHDADWPRISAFGIAYGAMRRSARASCTVDRRAHPRVPIVRL